MNEQLRRGGACADTFFPGLQLAQELANTFHEDFQLLVIEQQSHFEHLFAFTRFSVCPGLESRKAFIPFNPGTFADCPSSSGKVVQATVLEITKRDLRLDRPVQLFAGTVTDIVSYAYLVSIRLGRDSPQMLMKCVDNRYRLQAVTSI